jgi:hypothetical protein
MLKKLMRVRRRVTVGDWPEPQLPATVVERWRVGARLVAMAVVGFVAMIVSLLAG